MRWERQAAFWLGALCVLALFLFAFSSILLPFVAGLFLGYLLDPVADRLEKLGLNRMGATLVILAGFTVALVLLLLVVVPVLAQQLTTFIHALPNLIAQLQKLASQQGSEWMQTYGSSILQRLGIDPSASGDAQTSIGNLISQGGTWLLAFLTSLWSGGQALIGVFSLLVVTPVVAFYILLDWDRMVATIDSYVPVASRTTVRELAREIDRAIAGFLRGQSLVCLFLGVWYGLGLSLVGLNFGFLIGISAGVLSFIPYVGSLTALVLSAIIAIVQGWPHWGLFFMAMGVIALGQFLEGNILTPRLVGASVGLHPVWIMFALFAFGSLFGFTGLLVAVPVSAAIGVIVRFALRRYRASPFFTEGLPRAVDGLRP